MAAKKPIVIQSYKTVKASSSSSVSGKKVAGCGCGKKLKKI